MYEQENTTIQSAIATNGGGNRVTFLKASQAGNTT